MANFEQLKILSRGVRACNEWRIGNSPLVDLTGAHLPGIKLGSLDVHTHLDLHLSDLSNADFSEAEPAGAILVNSDATGAVFRGASLSGCEL